MARVKIPDSIDLWQLFQIKRNASQTEIDVAYKRLRNTKVYEENDLRLAWKIIRDPFISLSFEYYRSIQTMLEAGFFDDTLEPEHLLQESFNPNWLTTPLHKIQNQLSKGVSNNELPIVLLTTGAFSPIHTAHIKLLENTKQKLESLGRRVIGGYISPSHDGYVAHKYRNDYSLNIAHRLNLCEMAVKDNDWIMIDGWEAKYNPVSITYTDVIIRLDKYLTQHLKRQIEIVYVFGSDNANFAKAFIGQGSCAIVRRPGYDKNLEDVKDPAIINNPKIYFIDKATASTSISSSAIRLGQQGNLPINIKETFAKYKKNIQDKEKIRYLRVNYIIRNDLSWGLSKWRKLLKIPVDETNIELAKHLSKLIKEAFKKSERPDQKIKPTIVSINLVQQQKLIDILEKKTNLLNLDLCTNSQHKLHVSRLFGLSDGQLKAENIIARPGHAGISQQIKKLPTKVYTLIDDDIATGLTIRTIKKLLNKQTRISKSTSLLEELYLPKTINQPILDVVDLRDFIIGARDGGLVSKLPNGQIVRLPYLAPYVNLVSRAKIPPSTEFWLSMKLWEMNLSFFQKCKISLADTDPFFQKLMIYIGFKKGDLMEKICQWHLKQLEKSMI